MIFLEPHSGLANRIRVIVSGLSFAKLKNQELKIIWRKDVGLNCAFEDLFELIPNVEVIPGSLKFRLFNWIKNKRILNSIIYRLDKIDFTLFDNDFKKYVWSTNSDQINMDLIPKSVRNYYVRACNEFSADYSYLKFLIPVKSVQRLIDREVAKFPDNITGIHIRRTDNDVSIKESPLELFIEKIKTDLIQYPDMNFFLATDDLETETRLKALFPSKILAINKVNNRDSKEGIISAMVDLYCLAATQKIYGSYWSSFSSMASKIGGIPLIVIKK